MAILNVFRVLGDVSHFVSIGILLWSIHVNRSAEGVSLITQVLYAIVFCARYLDLFWLRPHSGLLTIYFWNTTLKIIYLSSSAYIIYIMMRKFARTREREKSWKFGAACLVGALLAAPFAMLIFENKVDWSFSLYCVTFSLILESVCVLPQLLLLRQTSVPTVIDSFYLLTLGCYRAFYIANWILRWATAGPESVLPDTNSVIFGVIQTMLYIDFAWVYWTRQRVKLRNGAVVDSDDLSRGFLVNKILGNSGPGPNGEATGENGPGNWGARGISVSADERNSTSRPNHSNVPSRGQTVSGEATTRPEEARGMLSAPDAFEDGDSDVDGALPSSRPYEVAKDVGDGEEWRQ